MWKLNLRQLILLLTVSTAVLVLANTFTPVIKLSASYLLRKR